MTPASRKPRKSAKKTSARPRSQQKASKRAQRGPSRPAAARSDEAGTDLVYSDIRRSMHGAILRHLR